MAMQIHGNYDNSGAYAERIREKQSAEREEKVKEGAWAAKEKGSAKLPEPQDEYISSEKSGKMPTGLYRVGQEENGSRKIFYDDPKAVHADGRRPKAGENRQGKPVEECVTNTDKVDKEIKKLKEKRQKLEQQLQSASGDEKKRRELEKRLAEIENELSQKDNDTYRRQNASVSG